MPTSDEFVIRRSTPADVPKIATLIRELATYERAADQAVATDAQLLNALHGTDAHVHCHVAEVGDHVVGLALWFLNFSTWQGRSGIYLEDLYVQPDYRHRGIGRQLLTTLAQLCLERDYGRLQWWVLDWNDPAIDFYTRCGAEAMDEWTTFRLSGQALINFAHS